MCVYRTGASIKYVRIEGGRGGQPKSVQMRTGGEGGSHQKRTYYFAFFLLRHFCLICLLLDVFNTVWHVICIQYERYNIDFRISRTTYLHNSIIYIIFEYKQQQNLFSLMNIYFKVCLFRLYAITAVSIPPSLTPRNAEISNYVGLGNIYGVRLYRGGGGSTWKRTGAYKGGGGVEKLVFLGVRTLWMLPKLEN